MDIVSYPLIIFYPWDESFCILKKKKDISRHPQDSNQLRQFADLNCEKSLKDLVFFYQWDMHDYVITLS